MPVIQNRDFNLGGLSDSKYQGLANSMYAMVGLDLHSEPGIIKVQQKLSKDSGTTIDCLVKAMVACSDGNTYLFGSTNGKIWKRTSAGTYSLEATSSEAAVLNAIEFDGYIYYASDNKLGRWQLGTAWSTRNDTWATFTKADTAYKPMKIKNGILYIGDGNLVAQVDETHTFVADALDLPAEHRVRALGELSTELLIGTFIADNVSSCRLFRWDTWSVSWSYDDDVPEVGINAFIPMDNATIVQAGTKGNIYYYDNSSLQQFKRLSGDWSGTNKAIVHSEAVASFKGLPLFGLSNSSGDPTLQGVYSFGSWASNYPKVLNLEYVISQAKLAAIEIGAITSIGDNILVSWKDGTTYGVDKIDTSNKYASAYMETRIINTERENLKQFGIKVYYRSLPASTAVVVKASVNGGAYATLTTVTDTDRKMIYTADKLTEANYVQFKLEFTVNTNDAPEIEGFDIYY